MKKVLFFFPHNPQKKTSGSKMRALALLKYFKVRQFQVDFVGLKNWDNWDSPSDPASWADLVSSIELLQEKPAKSSLLKKFISYKFPSWRFQKRYRIAPGCLPDHTAYFLKKTFEDLLKRNQYDYIVVSYAYWATLIKNNPYIGSAKTIIDTHDFLTSQHQKDTGFSIGVSFNEELSRLNLFDEVWSISSDEHYLFSQFLGKKVKYVPMTFDAPEGHLDPAEKQEFDLIYVASDNDNNIRSINWFFENVYPHLDSKIKICIVGNITSHIPDFVNVTKIPFAEDLACCYKSAKIALCPMLAGTGVKVKVVEALAYGLPVVCTLRGIDGLPNKIHNGCLTNDDPEIFADNIKLLVSNQAKYLEQKQQGVELFRSAFSVASSYKVLDKSFDYNTANEPI